MTDHPKDSKEALSQLVAKYEQNRDTYRSAAYNEAQARRELIDPLFQLLGWDIDNSAGVADQYKDVIHEDSLRVSRSIKAPDYAFRVGGTRKFFVEAKKPAVDITSGPLPALQLRRYAWSAGLPLSVVTNFEHLAVYDCRTRPKERDSATTGRLFLFHYSKLAELWGEVAGLLSREALWSGAFDRFVGARRPPRGTEQVDRAFLEELERSRKELALAFARNNAGLTSDTLGHAVQQTIDRLVFLRICEDRGLEPYARLQNAVRGDNAYKRLLQVFRTADTRYNSGLFHLRRSAQRSSQLDRVTPQLELDDAPIRAIVERLYFPQSPYEFSVIPPEILGRAYESFLGSTITLTSPTKAKVELKPEVRHAGGVFYTPRPIVSAIVRRVLDPLLEGLTPASAAELRVVDPACGSGSFLVVVYERLLAWHLDWYRTNDPKKHARGKSPRVFGSEGGLRLTTAEKRRVLSECVFGVDIDPQAVEVTKLALLLRMLEDESTETIGTTLQLFDDGALPDLDANIVQGNSLLSPASRSSTPADGLTAQRLRTLDWRATFPRVFARGGFSAVVGNPPYIRCQTLRDIYPEESLLYLDTFAETMTRSADIYVPFVARGLGMLRDGGRLGYILPNKFLMNDYARPLRASLAAGGHLDGLVDFGHHQVFDDATTYTCLLFLSKVRRDQFSFSRALPAGPDLPLEVFTVETARLGGDPWLMLSPPERAAWDAIHAHSVPLEDLHVEMNRGSSTGADDVFMLVEERDGLRTRDGEAVEIEPGILRQPIYATDFHRYRFEVSHQERVIFPYATQVDGTVRLLSEQELRGDFPLAFAFLSQPARKTKLRARKQFQAWYGYSAARSLAGHERAELVVPLLASRGSFAPLPRSRRRYCLMASGGFSLTTTQLTPLPPVVLLALLNSDVTFWVLRKLSSPFRGGWITCTKQFFERLPIPRALTTRGSGLAARLESLAAGATTERHALRGRSVDAALRTESEVAIDSLLADEYGLDEAQRTLVFAQTRLHADETASDEPPAVMRVQIGGSD